MERGILIAVEGPDKSGKETQVDELAKKFVLSGEEVATIDFPLYDTPSGQTIRAILDGLHILDVQDNNYDVQALFAINRYEQQARIEQLLMDGKVVICDRYLFSGIVYGTISGVEAEWLYAIQHSLVQPDMTILLDIDVDTYKERCSHYEELDSFESNLPFIQSTMEVYREVAEANDWIIVDGKDEVSEIANNIFNAVELKIREMEEEE